MTGPLLYLAGVNVLLIGFLWIGDKLTERTDR